MQEDPNQRVSGEADGFSWRESPSSIDVTVPVRRHAARYVYLQHAPSDRRTRAQLPEGTSKADVRVDIHPSALHIAVVDEPLIGASLQRRPLEARESLTRARAIFMHITGGALAGNVMVEDSYWVLTEGHPISVEVSLLKKPPTKEIWAAVFAAD